MGTCVVNRYLARQIVRRHAKVADDVYAAVSMDCIRDFPALKQLSDSEYGGSWTTAMRSARRLVPPGIVCSPHHIVRSGTAAVLDADAPQCVGKVFVLLHGKGLLVLARHSVPLRSPCALWVPEGCGWTVDVTPNNTPALCLVSFGYRADDSRAVSLGHGQPPAHKFVVGSGIN